MELSHLLARTAPLVIEFHSETIKTVVYTDRLTPLRSAELARLVEKDKKEQRNITALLLAELIREWDVTQDSKPFPPVYENLLQVPFSLLTHLEAEVSSFLQERAKPKPTA